IPTSLSLSKFRARSEFFSEPKQKPPIAATTAAAWWTPFSNYAKSRRKSCDWRFNGFVDGFLDKSRASAHYLLRRAFSIESNRIRVPLAPAVQEEYRALA